jgi:hypothetical protein
MSEDISVSSEIFKIRKRSKTKSLHLQARSAEVIINGILVASVLLKLDIRK